MDGMVIRKINLITVEVVCSKVFSQYENVTKTDSLNENYSVTYIIELHPQKHANIIDDTQETKFIKIYVTIRYNFAEKSKCNCYLGVFYNFI